VTTGITIQIGGSFVAALGLMAENGSDCCDHLEIRAARMCRGGTAPVAVMPCHLTAPGGDSAGRR